MKKFLVSLIFIITLIASTVMCAFAASPTKDGIYQVPIQIRSADSNAESEQSKFFYEAALLEIKSGNKYLTVASLSSIAGFEFYYYTNGSVSGSTKAAEKVKNIKIGDRTYPAGYKIPLNGSGQLVGIVMEIPFTDVSVSARIYIDYDNCKYIPEEDSTQGSTSGSSKLELPTSSEGSSYTYNYPYALKQPTAGENSNDTYEKYDYTYESELSEEAVSDKYDTATEKDSNEVTTAAQRSKRDDGSTGVIIGGVILGVILIGLAGWVIIAKAKEGKK